MRLSLTAALAAAVLAVQLPATSSAGLRKNGSRDRRGPRRAALRKPLPVGADTRGRRAECQDTAGNTLDADGFGCSSYTLIPEYCGQYDDYDFSSPAVCCACGGGDSSGPGPDGSGNADDDASDCWGAELEPDCTAITGCVWAGYCAEPSCYNVGIDQSACEAFDGGSSSPRGCVWQASDGEFEYDPYCTDWSLSYAPSTAEPTTSEPTTAAPATAAPTPSPSPAPTDSPDTVQPTVSPTMLPTLLPSMFPSRAPHSSIPTPAPTPAPTAAPASTGPSPSPTPRPTPAPNTPAPSASPSDQPSPSPSVLPTLFPTGSEPSTAPSPSPSPGPSVPAPTVGPSWSPPTHTPSITRPTRSPTFSRPTRSPVSHKPTASPTTLMPTTLGPTAAPTTAPTAAPSGARRFIEFTISAGSHFRDLTPGEVAEFRAAVTAAIRERFQLSLDDILDVDVTANPAAAVAGSEIVGRVGLRATDAGVAAGVAAAAMTSTDPLIITNADRSYTVASARVWHVVVTGSPTVSPTTVASRNGGGSSGDDDDRGLVTGLVIGGILLMVVLLFCVLVMMVRSPTAAFGKGMEQRYTTAMMNQHYYPKQSMAGTPMSPGRSSQVQG